MRIVLDTNIWSSFEDGSLPQFERLVDEHGLRLCLMPSALLEVIDIPHEEVRHRLIEGMAKGPNRQRMRTEADLFGEELVALIRRVRPEWLFQIPSPAMAQRHRNFWLKQIWRRALEDSTNLHLHQQRQAQKAPKQHVIHRQKHHRQELLRTNFVIGDLTQLVVTLAELDLTGLPAGAQALSLPGWDGTATAAWRIQLANHTWHHLSMIGPRAAITHEDRTETDWVEPYVDIRRMIREPESFIRMWLDDATIADVPRNWLNWAVDLIQSTEKVGAGNPADAQHSSYLVDCDLFATADARFIKVLERVRQDAPFTFARTVQVDGDRTVPTADRLEYALRPHLRRSPVVPE